LGHSLGASIPHRLLKCIKTNELYSDIHIAGYIMLAGTPRPIYDLMEEQCNYISEGDENVRILSDPMIKGAQKLREAINDREKYPDSEEILFGTLKYWRSLEEGDTKAMCREYLKLPIFLGHGERDYQVLVRDYNIWKDIFEGMNNVKFTLYPKLNHLFITGDKKSKPDEYAEPGFVSQELLEDIIKWINENSQLNK